MSSGNAIKKGLKHLVRVPIYSRPSFNTVTTRPYLIKAIEQSRWAGQQPVGLFIDVQGDRLSRTGRLSSMSLYLNDGQKHNMIYVIDLHTMGEDAFKEVTEEEFDSSPLLVHPDGRKKHLSEYVRGGLRGLLESEQVKVFWDVRRTADALYNQYGIKLNGVREVQLMEYATRPSVGDPANIYPGLMARPLDAMRVISTPMVDKADQEKVAKFFSKPWVRGYQSLQGTNSKALLNEMFNRPYNFNTDFFKFCLSNVRLLPTIYDTYAPLLTQNHWKLIKKATDNRLARAQEKDYNAWDDKGILENQEIPWTMSEKLALLKERTPTWKKLANTATKTQQPQSKDTVQDSFPESQRNAGEQLKDALKEEPAETATENREAEVATQNIEQSTLESAEGNVAPSSASPSELQVELPTEEAGQVVNEKPSDSVEEQTNTGPTDNSPVEAKDTTVSQATEIAKDEAEVATKAEASEASAESTPTETKEAPPTVNETGAVEKESGEAPKEGSVEQPKEEQKKSTWGWF